MNKIETKHTIELTENEINFIREALEMDVDNAAEEIDRITDAIQNGEYSTKEKREMSMKLTDKRQEHADKLVLLKDIGGLVGVHYCGV